MAQNIVKDKIMEMVKREVKTIEGAVLTWPDHTIKFLGPVAAGSGQIELRDIDDSEILIFVKTPYGRRSFRVKVTEMI